ncbi:MAG: nitroreductase family deazaflavin-dependent oxidoreductase [bacterium]|nr:nitroreductase family deazaflavin-dependent oxidoreductase [bacterium]
MKRIAIVLCVYVGLVVAFESLIGFFQPADEKTLVISTLDGDGNASERVLARLTSGDQLYVAANHWPRRWYRQALENPDVHVTLDGPKQAYRAVPASDEEHDRLGIEHDNGIMFRILTGFPPRKFIRLDPQ